MAQEHVDIADGERHEPKGAAAAAVHSVYVSDGAEAGAWFQQTVALTVRIPDLSAADSVWVVSPIAGEIEAYYCVLNNAITGSDTELTLKIGGVGVVGSEMAVAVSGSTAGTVDSATPTAAKTVTKGQAIEVLTDGVSSTTCIATITLLIRPVA